MIPTIGRIVRYKLSADDERQIHQSRIDAGRYMGNSVQAGEVYPAMIVASWNPREGSHCNLKVFLDGHDDYWATSRSEGDSQGEWRSPTAPVKPA